MHFLPIAASQIWLPTTQALSANHSISNLAANHPSAFSQSQHLKPGCQPLKRFQPITTSQTWLPTTQVLSANHSISNSCTESPKSCCKLQALVYDIPPSTTAVFSYAIGSRKLSANERFFCWCSNSSTFVTNNSSTTRHVIYSSQQSLHQQKQKPESFESRQNYLFFTQGGCVSCLQACLGARLLLQSY